MFQTFFGLTVRTGKAIKRTLKTIEGKAVQFSCKFDIARFDFDNGGEKLFIFATIKILLSIRIKNFPNR